MSQKLRFLSPWSYVGQIRRERLQRQTEELRRYLEVATPVALLVERLYDEWREAVAEPIQDGQKAANASAIFWWQVASELRSFEQLVPPKSAQRYHRIFVDALRNASQGAVAAKNGFRFNKFSMVGSGMESLDRYLELMAQAEAEISRLVRKHRLIED